MKPHAISEAPHPVVSREEWLTARVALLERDLALGGVEGVLLLHLDPGQRPPLAAQPRMTRKWLSTSAMLETA